MPEVSLNMTIQAPVEDVWAAVVDIERYPSIMDNVRSVEVLDHSDTRRVSAWSIVLKGSILEWEEEEWIDHNRHTMHFRQLRGDLASFDGGWTLTETAPGCTTATFEVTFEIGIPLLAEMLNPVAHRSLSDNCQEMLRGVERDVAPA